MTLPGLLFALGVGGAAASAPMFLAHFRHAREVALPPVRVPPVGVLFAIEAIKVALFSALAAWAGARFARGAGLDAPLLRALVDSDHTVPTAALARAAAVALLAGGAAMAIERALVRWTAPLGTPRRAPMSALARASGVSYMALSVEPWFRWGILALVIFGLRALGAPDLLAIAGGAALSALAYGVFAIPSTMQTFPDAPRLARVRRAIVVGGAPTALFGVAAAAAGLEAAILAHAFAFALRVAIESPRAPARAPRPS